jgi:DsbC/DsbD-like thiol-disulfide interchange protein
MAIRTLFAGLFFFAALLAMGPSVEAHYRTVDLAQAEEDPVPQVHAQTIFDVKAFVPGKLAHMIVILDVPDEWHIYWANGGETGMPTTVQVSGPEGWKVGDARFPGPVMYLDDQGNRSYVLEGQVAFFIPIVAPGDAAVEDIAQFEVSVDWLLCKEVCHSGSYQATPKLSVASGAPVVNSDPRIASLRSALPLQGGAPGAVGLTLTGSAIKAELNFFALDSREFEFFAFPESPMVVVERKAEVIAESRSQRTFQLEPALGKQPSEIRVNGILRIVLKEQVLYYEVQYQGALNRQPTQR